MKLLGTARARKSAGLALLREDPLERRFGHRYNPQERRFQNTHTHTRTLAGYPSVGVQTCLCRPYSSTSRRIMPCVVQNTHTHTRTLAGYPSVGVHTCLCRPYNSTSRRTIPCVEGQLCHVPATSPKPTEAHGCQGGYGGRLHGTCGSIADDNEMHRICSHCLAKGEKRKAVAPPKRKATAPPKGAGAGESKARKTKKFLTFEKKVEVLDMLQRKVLSHESNRTASGARNGRFANSRPIG